MWNVAPRVRPDQLADATRAIVLGKARVYLSHSLQAMLQLSDPKPALHSRLQVLLNDTARIILRRRRSDAQKDGMTTRQLLDKANIPSLNEIIIVESGMASWHAMVSDGPLSAEFNDLQMDTRTRAATTQLLRVPPPTDMFMRNAARVWNTCSELRASKGRYAAKSALQKFARSAPI